MLTILELEQLCVLARKMGHEAKLEREEDGSPAFRILVPEADGYAGPSYFTTARIGIECVSPEWLVKTSIEMINAATATTKVTSDQSWE